MPSQLQRLVAFNNNESRKHNSSLLQNNDTSKLGKPHDKTPRLSRPANERPLSRNALSLLFARFCRSMCQKHCVKSQQKQCRDHLGLAFQGHLCPYHNRGPVRVLCSLRGSYCQCFLAQRSPDFASAPQCGTHAPRL